MRAKSIGYQKYFSLVITRKLKPGNNPRRRLIRVWIPVV
jgi:hypothetical protein